MKKRVSATSRAGRAARRAGGAVARWCLGLGAVATLALTCVWPLGAGAAGGQGPATAGPGLAAIRLGTAHDALYDVAFDGPRGFAVGALGTLLVSDDGGARWQQVPLKLQGVALLSVATRAGHGVVVGQAGATLVSPDGRTWKPVASGTTARLLAVDMNAQGVAVAVGAFGTILRSSDWGASWTPITVDWSGYTADGAEPHLYDVHVAPDGQATVVGEFELVLRSDASGAGWKALHQGSRSLFALSVLDDGRLYAVGQSGALITSTDQGRRWQSVDTGTAAILTGLQVTSGGDVIVSGINTVLVGRDRGSAWQRVVRGLPGNRTVQAIGQGTTPDGQPRFVVVGSGGSIAALEL